VLRTWGCARYRGRPRRQYGASTNDADAPSSERDLKIGNILHRTCVGYERRNVNPSTPTRQFMPSPRGCSVRVSQAIACPGARPPTRAHNLDRDRRRNSGASETAWCQTSGNVDNSAR
jgi:hypothetical protein